MLVHRVYQSVLSSMMFFCFCFAANAQPVVQDQPTQLKSDEVIWYPLRQKKGFHPDTMIIRLLGRTTPQAPVEVDINNIFIIRNDGQDKNVELSEIRPKAVSTARGLFSLILELPLGLSQVPVIIDSKRLLLTMDVAPKSVKTNVKITPIKRKSNQVVLPQKLAADFGLGFHYGSFDVDYESGNLSFSELVTPGFYLGGNWQRDMWSVNFSYERSSLGLPASISGKALDGSGEGLEILTVSSGYRLRRAINSKWLKFNVNQITFPFVGEKSLTRVFSQNISLLQLGLGGGWNKIYGKWAYEINSYLQYPFDLGVESGKLDMEPTVFIAADADITYAYRKNWLWGGRAFLSYNSFDYKLQDTANSVFDEGSGLLLILNTNLFLRYEF